MPDLTKAGPGWYCFRALPKKEHIAAQLLCGLDGIRAFCPRIAHQKHTRRGKVRFIEGLFPGYVFVHADLREQYRLIRSTQGIRDVVSFGERVPRVPDALLEELKMRMDGPEEDVMDIPDPVLEPGMEVRIMSGPLQDFDAVVSGKLDGRKRVTLLLEFLGRSLEIRLPECNVQAETSFPDSRISKD